MENQIPEEARVLAQEFLAAQQRVEAERKAHEKESFSKREFNRSNVRGPANSKTIERFAVSNGWIVETGNGKHGKHLVNPETGYRQPLPDHGGRDLARGIGRAIINRISSN